MHDQTGRLVDHDQRGVLVHHRERDLLRLRSGGLGRRHRHRDGIGAVDAMAGIADCALPDRDLAVEDQRLHTRARQLGEPRGEQPIEAFALVLAGHRDRFNMRCAVRHAYAVARR